MLIKSKFSGFLADGTRTPFMGGGSGGILSPITDLVFGKPPAPPPAPDYRGAAQETAQGNLAAAQAATSANRVSQYTPYGNLVYSQTGVDSQGNPTWRADTSLAPAQQQMLDIQNATGVGLGNTINSSLGRVQQTMGQGFNPNFDAQAYLQANPDVAAAGIDPYQHYMTYGRTEGRQFPLSKGLTTNVEGANLGQVGQAQQAQGIGSGETAQRVGGGPQFQNLEAANALRRSGNTDALQRSLGQNVGMEGWDRASNLLMQRLDPQLERQQERQDAQLAAQGIPIGSQAYTRAKQDLGQQQNDARIQAQLQAQGIQQNLFGQELQAGQFGNQATTQQQQNLLQNLGFSNQAQQQDFANRQAQLAFNNQFGQQGFQNQLAGQQANNQAIAQNFGQGLSAQQLQNQAAQQNFANQLASNQQNNAAMQQMFANRMANANLGNTAQQQQYNQALTNYNLPLNTLSSLRSGAQVQNPSFVNVPQQATTSGADFLGATQMGFNANMGAYNAQAAERNNMMQGLFGLGGAALMSDIRTKENIKQIYWMPNGLPVYEYEYKPEFKNHPSAGHGKFIGVMAQEVEMVQPEAVITNADGYKMVNYGALNA
jgi:hypothetical protein